MQATIFIPWHAGPHRALVGLWGSLGEAVADVVEGVTEVTPGEGAVVAQQRLACGGELAESVVAEGPRSSVFTLEAYYTRLTRPVANLKT